MGYRHCSRIFSRENKQVSDDMIKSECEGLTKPCRGEGCLNKDEIEEGGSVTRLDDAAQDSAAQGFNLRGRNRRRLGFCKNGSERVTTARRAHGKLAVHCRLLIYTATPSLSKSTDMTSHLLIIPTRGGYNGVARAFAAYAVRLTYPLYHSVFQAAQRADGEQGEHCRDGLHPVEPGARKRWPNWLKAGRSWPHSALMGSFSPWPQPCRAAPRNLG